VETRTEENYRAYLRNHILPRWDYTTLGDITTLDVTLWLKDLRKRYAVPPSPASSPCSPCCSTTPSTNTSFPAIPSTDGAAGRP
jgi:hypothetical protein